MEYLRHLQPNIMKGQFACKCQLYVRTLPVVIESLSSLGLRLRGASMSA